MQTCKWIRTQMKLWMATAMAISRMYPRKDLEVGFLDHHELQ